MVNKMINILLTGADGQLGSDFKKLFENKGISYMATDYRNLNITDKVQMEAFFSKNDKFTHIINCAAYNNVDKAETDKNVFLVNTEAPAVLAEFAKKIGADYVTYSTDFVFDGKKDSPYSEEDETNPLSKYGKSKREGEKAVLETYSKAFVIRTSWLFGTGNINFSKKILEWSKHKKELSIVDDEVSSPTYSKDLALFSWKLIQTGKYGIYHISNNEEASKYAQAKYILEKIGWKGLLKKAKTEDFNLPAKRPGYSYLSSEKVEKLLNEKIPDWKSGIDRYLEEMKEKGEI
jgi:dTDP-4-dehydrorhamnose reductase